MILLIPPLPIGDNKRLLVHFSGTVQEMREELESEEFQAAVNAITSRDIYRFKPNEPFKPSRRVIC